VPRATEHCRHVAVSDSGHQVTMSRDAWNDLVLELAELRNQVNRPEVPGRDSRAGRR